MTPTMHRPPGRKIILYLILLLLFISPSHSTPPSYTTFKREQRTTYSPDPAELMRIWVVYVGQGDGILIQLPTKYNYDPDPTDSDNQRRERIDVVVDGGSNPTSEANRMTDFLSRIYGNASPMIEYIVITHHDQDHVVGITKLLGESGFTFDSIYHNGLASYRGGKKGIPGTNKPSNVVGEEESNHQVKRAMGFFNAAKELEAIYLVKSLTDLRTAYNNDELQGIYEDLAGAVVKRASHNELKAFERADVTAPFIAERQTQRGQSFTDINFTVLWPLTKAKSYGGNNWGETINGNSVTFRMDYKGFSMVFTGDQNDKSEPELLNYLRGQNKIDLLDCDVLKVPHHGSSHGVQEFFKRDGFNPVLSVASMGDVGFKSKQMSNNAWQHPSTDIIDWLGGPHRVYHTFAQERAFSWDQITTEAKRQEMIERSHILIETDGTWFRVVEVAIETGNPLQPPTVTQTRRGNGTQWIRATKN